MSENQTRKTKWLSPLVLEDGFTVQFRGDHVYVRLGKDLRVNPEQRSVIWGLIARTCEENGSSRVLVEGEVPEGIFQPSEVIDAGLKTAAVPSLWLAFCFENFRPDETSELYETVAASKGGRVKFFTSTESALEWLRNNAPA